MRQLRAQVAAVYEAAWPRTRNANKPASEALGGGKVAGQLFPHHPPREYVTSLAMPGGAVY